MATATVDSERKLQNKVLRWLTADLGYSYLGDLSDIDNPPIKEDLLEKNLRGRGYGKEETSRAIAELQKTAGNQSDNFYNVNKAVYELLRYGRQGVKDRDGTRKTVHYIDWANIDRNDFAVAEEVTVLCSDGLHRKRPDLVLYVNGIALGVIELKSSFSSAGKGVRQMVLNQKKDYIPYFFVAAQLLLAGNEAEGIFYGTTETPAKYYFKWKENSKADDDLSVRIKELQGQEKSRLRDDLISLCEKERFLSLIHDFIIFDNGIKKTARHNQYFANIAARKFVREKQGGIIWNTQGSGKSLIMAWLARWILENVEDGRVVIITDRAELDDQIETLFVNVGDKDIIRAESCDHLRNLLNTHEGRIICSLIHKYGHNAGKDADMGKYLKELEAALPADYEAKGRIVAFIDECHRTNSGKLHRAAEHLMPEATFIGFTGTPLLKSDKKKYRPTSMMTFGPYIHTYKYDEGVADGVILDLRYEARDVDQTLSSKDKIDVWFEAKTSSLTKQAKQKLKDAWVSINKLYSSEPRLKEIAADIFFDLTAKNPRVVADRGTAMLATESIYEACHYWELFQKMGFTKCAIVTSYAPTENDVRTAAIDTAIESEEEYKKSVYDKMLGGKSIEEFERNVKKQFRENPAAMKLLIVVNMLLTGFDAPSATYLYIDRTMHDQDLFQAICRVNRLDGEDKDFGYIIDYKDSFKSLQKAVKDYTSGEFDAFDREDVEGLVKNRYDQAKAEMDGSLSSLEELLAEVPAPQSDSDYIEYFCGENSETAEQQEYINRRDTLYKLGASLTRSFAVCSEYLASLGGYSEEEIEALRTSIHGYNKIKTMVRLASCDYIDLKPYEADMRFILDTYIRADESRVIGQLADYPLVELLLKQKTTTPAEFLNELPGDKDAQAEIIENNLQHEIIKKMDSNRVHYAKLSQMLDKLVKQRKAGAMANEEYLRQVREMAEAIFHPENSIAYPETVKDSAGKRVLFNYARKKTGDDKYAEKLALAIDSALWTYISPGWKDSQQKMQKVRSVIFDALVLLGRTKDEANVEEHMIFEEIVKKQEEYDGN